MESDWPFVTVESIAVKAASGPFGSNLRGSEYVQDGVPVIRGGNLSGPRFTDEGYVYVTDAKAESLSSSLAYPLDIVFAARGSVGAVGLVPEERHDRYLLSSNLVKATINPEKADPRFVFYYFRSWRGQHEILAHVNTTGVPKIERALESLRSFRVPSPPLDMQQAIACILGTIDDKIELNQRRNKTLAETAKAVFKSWFVDLDPVWAKREGKQPAGMDAKTAALFPDRFADSELGPIPDGWEVKQLRDICESVRYGYTASARAEEVGPKFLRITDIVPRSIDWDTVPFCEIEKKDVKKYLLEEGDIVVARTGANVGCAKRIGKMRPEAVFASYLVRMRISSDYSNYLMGLMVESQEYKDFIWVNRGGSAQPHANARIMTSYSTVLPPRKLQQRFDSAMWPFFDQQDALAAESRILAALRDVLLPKLISGELRVPDAERIVEDNL